MSGGETLNEMQSNKDGKMTDFIWWALVLKHMP